MTSAAPPTQYRTDVAAFRIGLSNADCVHVFGKHFADIVRKIRHHCILWDIDELPLTFRDKLKDTNATFSDSEKVTLETIGGAWKKSRIVFSSSLLERRAEFKEPVVVPNTHSRSASIHRQPLPNTLLFVGNFNYLPNIVGILYFVLEILPLLRHEISITIVGRRALDPKRRARLDQLKDNDRVEIFYDVASCAPYYDQSMASIAPILSGGGTRIKILESFASMCPVISTQKGCEGLAVSDERELLIADTPDGFASACTKLLDNAAFNKKIAKSAHGFFLKEHSQEVVDNIVKHVLAEVLMTLAHHNADP